MGFLVLAPLWADELRFKNGDRITGEIISFNKTTIRFKAFFGEIDVKRSDVTGGWFGDVTGTFAEAVKTVTPSAPEAAPTRAPEKTAAPKKPVVSVKLDPPPRKGLIFEYLFNNNFKDTSGNGHVLKNENGVTLTDGVEGKNTSGAYAGGKGNYLRLDNTGAVDSLESFTLSFWMKLQESDKNQYLVSKWDKSLGKKAVGKLAVSFFQKHLYFYIVDDQGFYHGIKQACDIEADRWNHIAVSFDKGVMVFYLNGSQAARKETGAAGLLKDTTPVHLMTARSFNNSTWAYYNVLGKMDNIRLYGRALTPLEIKRLHYEGEEFLSKIVKNG